MQNKIHVPKYMEVCSLREHSHLSHSWGVSWSIAVLLLTEVYLTKRDENRGEELNKR